MEMGQEEGRVVEKNTSAAKVRARKCGLKQIVIFIVILMVFGAVVALTVMGYTLKMVVAIKSLGVFGYLIFILLFIFTALPFGYGYSILITACGSAYGWLGLVPTIVGTVLGLCIAYAIAAGASNRGFWIRQRG